MAVIALRRSSLRKRGIDNHESAELEEPGTQGKMSRKLVDLRGERERD